LKSRVLRERDVPGAKGPERKKGKGKGWERKGRREERERRRKERKEERKRKGGEEKEKGEGRKKKRKGRKRKEKFLLVPPGGGVSAKRSRRE
jgi:hypothetical protein